jgi:hypothetical protein
LKNKLLSAGVENNNRKMQWKLSITSSHTNCSLNYSTTEQPFNGGWSAGSTQKFVSATKALKPKGSNRCWSFPLVPLASVANQDAKVAFQTACDTKWQFQFHTNISVDLPIPTAALLVMAKKLLVFLNWRNSLTFLVDIVLSLILTRLLLN